MDGGQPASSNRFKSMCYSDHKYKSIHKILKYQQIVPDTRDAYELIAEDVPRNLICWAEKNSQSTQCLFNRANSEEHNHSVLVFIFLLAHYNRI